MKSKTFNSNEKSKSTSISNSHKSKVETKNKGDLDNKHNLDLYLNLMESINIGQLDITVKILEECIGILFSD